MVTAVAFIIGASLHGIFNLFDHAPADTLLSIDKPYLPVAIKANSMLNLRPTFIRDAFPLTFLLTGSGFWFLPTNRPA
jgi:hypothetical protein